MARISAGAAVLLAALFFVTVALLPVDSAAAATPPSTQALSKATTGGGVLAFGTAADLGSLAGDQIKEGVVAMASTPDSQGYWLAAADGGVFTFGDAGFFGSAGGLALSEPIVGMAATPSGRGYWLVGADGGVFTFGDAGFFGSAGGLALSQPIVGIVATPSGRGYWLVGADGGVFTFGDAGFFGSAGGLALSEPIVGMAATPSGRGYWLVGADGGVFTFGDAGFFGSAGGLALSQPIVGIVATPSGRGYRLVAADGGVFTFGDAGFFGSDAGQVLDGPVVAVAGAGPGGYWLAEGSPKTSPFSPAVVADLDASPGLVTAAVEDLNTGNIFTYRPGLALDTASSVKPEILGTLLSQVQAAHRALTPAEGALATAMIEVSDNSAASTLFAEVGAAPAVQSFDDAVGLTGTHVNSSWAVTTTTATDQLAVFRTYVRGNSILDDASRSYGLSLLSRVEPSQVFGVDYGIAPGALQAIKTGRLPSIGVYNAVGWIEGDGRNYLIAAYTQSMRSEASADAAMDEVSRAAWSTLGS